MRALGFRAVQSRTESCLTNYIEVINAQSGNKRRVGGGGDQLNNARVFSMWVEDVLML